jgi:crotonobetainyl-CoA:carnitine CoA-transferase CaiB-like acyl-CoA transferase
MIDLLQGVRILDFTHVHAGPLCTYQLALMGAEVFKVEPPGSGEMFRSNGGDADMNARRMGALFVGQNAGKKSIAADLTSREIQRIIQEKITPTVDAVVHNMRPGTPEKLGIGYAQLEPHNPRLVYCAISGYGQSGPYADRAAMDHLIQGVSGMMAITGPTEGPPCRIGYSAADSASAFVAAQALLAGLFRARATDKGAFLDVSMLEACIAIQGQTYYNHLVTGRQPMRVGPNPLARIGPTGTFECADGALLLVNANNHKLFELACRAIGREDIFEDRRYHTPQDAAANWEELRAKFAEIYMTRPAIEWEELLCAEGVPAGRVQEMPEIVQSPQLAYREAISTQKQVAGVDRDLRFIGAGFQLDGEPTTPTGPPPVLGAHTREVLAAAGVAAEDIERLEEEGLLEVAN